MRIEWSPWRMAALACGAAIHASLAGAQGLSVGGTYPTRVNVVAGHNTCGDVTVRDNPTVIVQRAGDSTFSLTHTAISATGTVIKTGAFSTKSVVLALNDARYTIAITGQFSKLGLEAIVHLEVTQSREPKTCMYDVHWAALKDGAPNVLPPVRADKGASFHYPPSAAPRVTRDVRYRISDTSTQMMDVYRPVRTPAVAAPTLIFFSVGQRNAPLYTGWARAAASKGLVAVVPDLGRDPLQNFAALVRHLESHASVYGVDPERLAVYAGSGYVSTAFPLVESPNQTAVKAAVMLYGTASIDTFRADLPILYVRAGLDRPELSGAGPRGMIALASKAIEQGAPLTFMNHSTGHHAFELVDADAITVDIIDLAIEFVRRSTAASYQSALRQRLPEAMASRKVVAGDFHGAAAAYAPLVASRPTDALLALAYGEALLGDRQYAAACAEFARLKDQGLGARDVGVPAARACAQSGDPAAAIAWLRSIPSQFMPANLEKDSAFVAIADRPDFRALFRP